MIISYQLHYKYSLYACSVYIQAAERVSIAKIWVYIHAIPFPNGVNVRRFPLQRVRVDALVTGPCSSFRPASSSLPNFNAKCWWNYSLTGDYYMARLLVHLPYIVEILYLILWYATIKAILFFHIFFWFRLFIFFLNLADLSVLDCTFMYDLYASF